MSKVSCSFVNSTGSMYFMIFMPCRHALTLHLEPCIYQDQNQNRHQGKVAFTGLRPEKVNWNIVNTCKHTNARYNHDTSSHECCVPSCWSFYFFLGSCMLHIMAGTCGTLRENEIASAGNEFELMSAVERRAKRALTWNHRIAENNVPILLTQKTALVGIAEELYFSRARRAQCRLASHFTSLV